MERKLITTKKKRKVVKQRFRQIVRRNVPCDKVLHKKRKERRTVTIIALNFTVNIFNVLVGPSAIFACVIILYLDFVKNEK